MPATIHAADPTVSGGAGPPASSGPDARGTGAPPHLPVMVDRVAALLAVETTPDDTAADPVLLVDATVGAGGHAAALLTASAPHVRLLGFDRDPRALELAEARLAPFGERATLVHAGYDELGRTLDAVAPGIPVLAVLYDLGVSSMQLDEPGRGFAFRTDEPLDMRMDAGGDAPGAAELVNGADVEELTDILRTLGEERHARRIARAIVAARPLTTTAELADVVRGAVPAAARHGRTHPATRTFQALRIAVNAELDRFRASLPQALERTHPTVTDVAGDREPDGPGPRGGRIAVLSYHSLEDRIAKRAFADAARGCVCPPDLPVCACGRLPYVRSLTRGMQRPADAEVAANPRARPAKLRAVEKTAPGPLRPDAGPPAPG